MIRYKLLAVAFSIFMFLDEGFSEIRAEAPKQNIVQETASTNAASPETYQEPAPDPKAEAEPAPDPEPVPEPITVTATVYFPEPGQTDATPLTTADGSKINKKNPGEHRWIAVSRDLLSRWGGEISYGDSLVVSGISEELDGLYIVRDTMHKRLRKRIDILVGRHDDVMGKWKNVQISKFIATSGS